MATPIPANRARFRLDEILAATGGRAIELAPTTAVRGISTDSRTVSKDELFVAVRGGCHDGHRFAGVARERGAVALVAAGSGVDGPRVEVDGDTLEALGALARAHVDRLAAHSGSRPTLAVGGAAGKTTTKTLAAAAVRALFGETLVTAGNLNNRIGVPMTLLTLERKHRAIVCECGTSEKGEIETLGRIVRPDVAVVTNVGIEHSEGLGSLEEIADEEAALFSAARRAAATASEEPLLVERLAASRAPRQLLFGSASDADLRLTGRRVLEDGRSEVSFRLVPTLAEIDGSERAEAKIVSPLLGPAAAANLGAALCGALALLDRPATERELARATRALGEVEAVPGRLAPFPLRELFLLDDTYNSNPKSVPAALAAAGEIAERRRARLIVALGDMLELGDLSVAEHERMIGRAASSGAALLLLVGRECGLARARLSFATPFEWFPDSTAAASALPALVRPGDVILIKGSRGIRMERLIEALATSV